MIGTKEIKISFMTEKKAEHGEDAPPLLLVKDRVYAVGVFDGMGGAGAATCESEYGVDYTKAYVASRITKDVVEKHLVDCMEKREVTADSLKTVILERLKKEQEDFPPKVVSKLRSRLIRDYPTTMALVTLFDKDEIRQIDSYWAGDSHCYLWNKKGFFQISKDDLEENNDPMENLHNDAPISNCACADRDFQVNHISLSVDKSPVVILCATDGCFGYYPTPMHFEYIIKECLRIATDEMDWQEKIKERIQKVTGDDTSLSLIGVGFSSFEELKHDFTDYPKSMNNLMKVQKNIEEAQELYKQYTEEYEKVAKNGWEDYKTDYMKYINDNQHGNA